MLMESDACNLALKQNGSATEGESEEEGELDEADKNGTAREEGDTGGLFKRSLRSITSTTSLSKSQVLTRHRDEYTKARLAIQEGRHLSETMFVEIEMENVDSGMSRFRLYMYSFISSSDLLLLLWGSNSQVKMLK